MRFLSLYTPSAAPSGPPSPQHMETMERMVGEMLANGTLETTGALMRRDPHAMRVTLKDGEFTVEEGAKAASDWMAATGFAVLHAGSREELVEGIHHFLATAGDGASQIIQLMDGPPPTSGAEKPAVSDHDNPHSVMTAWLDAIGRKDAKAALALMSASVVEYNLAPPLKARRPTEAGYQAWFDTWDGPLSFEEREVHVECEGGIAFAHALVCMRGTKVGGQPSELWYRETIGLRREDGHWRIAHIHDSVPFYMDGSDRAALDLKPKT